MLGSDGAYKTVHVIYAEDLIDLTLGNLEDTEVSAIDIEKLCELIDVYEADHGLFVTPVEIEDLDTDELLCFFDSGNPYPGSPATAYETEEPAKETQG